MTTDVNKQRATGIDERKYDSHIVSDTEAPQVLQLPRQAVCFQSRIEGIRLKDRNSVPETYFQILIAANFSLERFSKS
jgi:hypothetical protein